MSVVRRTALCAAFAVVASATFGAAATFGTPSRSMSAGGDAVGRCDSAGITVTYTGAPGTVTHVVVSGLASTCDGGTAWATVADLAGGNVAGGGPAAITGGSATIDISPDRPAEVVRRYEIAVTGP